MEVLAGNMHVHVLSGLYTRWSFRLACEVTSSGVASISTCPKHKPSETGSMVTKQDTER